MCRASGLPTAIECSRAAHISDDENSWVKETTEELDIASEVAKSGLLERDFGDPPQVPPKSMLRANSSNVVHRPYGLDSITDCSYQATRSGIMTRSAVSSPVIFTREDADRDVRAMSNLALCQASRDIPKKQKSLICRTISFGSRLIQSRHQTGNKQDLSAPATGSSPFIKKARAFLRPSIGNVSNSTSIVAN